MAKEKTFKISGNIVDINNKEINKGTVIVKNGIISDIIFEDVKEDELIMPGLIDSHIHIESSMLIPSEFARLASVHGTVATVSDPHEIANVLGIPGVHFMIENGNKVPFKFYFGAPSCVPATPFETAGFRFGEKELDELLSDPDIHYLSEMMNFPGVINRDAGEMKKIDLARKYKKPVDGHAPGVNGNDAEKYASAGVTTDHECFTMEEALDKIKYGMKIQIREGSAAKNFEALIGLMKDHSDKVLFCSDDKHPDDLVKGHINQMVVRAINKGYDPLDVLHSVIINPVKHYNMNVGLLSVGDPADFIVVDNFDEFNVLNTFIDGELVAENGQPLMEPVTETPVNNFNAKSIDVADIAVKAESQKVKVIEALEGQLITNCKIEEIALENGMAVSNPHKDILKIVVVNRYVPARPAVAFIRNFGLKEGAIASSVAHDSHNIVAVGVSDESIAKAINLVIEQKGGVSLSCDDGDMILPLPVAGLMSDANGYKVSDMYKKIDAKAHDLGTKLRAPYMTLSFMALLVIPQLKLSDKGLFDGNSFSFTELFS